MRRRSPGVVDGQGLASTAVARAEVHDPDFVIASLEGLVTPARRERLLDVISARLSCVTVMLDAPHDPHNGAAVVRSCEAFGVSTLHVVEAREAFLVAASVARSAERWVDVRCYRQAEVAVEAVRSVGMELVAARANGDMVPSELARLPRFALVLGNERDGISDPLGRACTRSVRVPMRGFVDSLNVSVTAAILLSAATAGRAGDLDEGARKRLYARGLYFSVARADEVLRAGGVSAQRRR